MDATGKSYYGLKRQAYTLDKKLGSGGEGDVYSIKQNPNQVAKIFKVVKPGREDKLKATINLNIPSRINGVVRLALPEDILYENGRMVGFVMPIVDDTLRLIKICRENDKDKDAIFPNYSWKHGVVIAYNFAELIEYLHSKGVIIGDFNPNNFVVDGKHGGLAVFVDCDSFDIRDPKTRRRFPCEVAFPEVAAPELQNVTSFKGRHTVESDNFSLAIHIFRLLMNNSDPFGAVDIGVRKNSSSSAGNGNQAIIKGECPYVRNLPNKKIQDNSLPFEFLPSDIRALFIRVFKYNEVTAISKNVIQNRPTAGEWAKVLRKYAINDQHVATCSHEPKHKYPSHNTECPWCKLEWERAQRMYNIAGPNATSSVTQSSGSHTQTTGNTGPLQNAAGNKGSTQPFYPGKKQRESTWYYALYIIFGIACGFLTGPFCFDSYELEKYGLYFSDATAITIVAVIGFIYAASVAYLTHEKYENASTGVWYMFSTLNALIVPAFITSLIVWGIVLAVYAFTIVIVISCLFGICCNS